jgi:hypothetical protein
MTYQVIITEEVANVAVTSNSYPIIINYNAVIEQASGNTTYGDSNVRVFLASGTNTANIITTGNVAGAYILGNGSQLTGIAATYGNANVAANLAAFGSNPISTTGNITAGYVVGNGSLLSNLTGANVTGTVANATYALNSNAASFATQATFAGTANAVAGANVSGTVANATYALNSNAATFATQATSATTANAVAGANVSGTVANATYALNSNAATFAGTVTTAAQPNITSVGILTALNTSGAVSATGNITGGNLQINTDAVITGNLTVNGTTTTINSNVVTVNDKTFVLANNQSTGAGVDGSGIIAGNPAVASILYSNANTAWETNIGVRVTGAVSATGNITSAGNISGNYILGNGSQLTGLPATYGNANVADFLSNGFGSNTITTTGNITTGNLLTGGLISVTGNITGSNINSAVFQAVNSAGGVLRNASGSNQLQWGAGGGDNLSLDVSTNISGANAQINISPTGNSGHVHIKPTGTPSVEIAPTFTGSMNNMIIGNVTPAAVSATTVSASGNIDGGNLRTAGVVSATGNITGANLVATANLTSTQQTVVGTANVGTTGNIVMSGKNIATDMAFVPDGGNATNAALSRIMLGTGWNGNITHSAVQNRMLIQDSFARGNTGTSVQLFGSDPIVSLTGNVTNAAFRQQALGARVRIGGGSAANTINHTFATGTVGAVAALQPNIDVGNASPYFLGNTVISQALLNGGFITVNPGSTVTNAYGMVPGIVSNGAGANVTNYIGFASNLNGYGVGSVTGNVYGVYHGSNATLSTTGIATANLVRSAPGYYAFYNADSVAQVQLGSLRSYNEFQYATATSGTVNIDKTNAQVQFVAPTANVTIGDFQNFVSTANDGTNNDTQTDTVTLIIQQGATPYTVTLPTGNASIKYAGGISTVGTTANAVTMVNITAFRSTANATLYLTTVSSEFV